MEWAQALTIIGANTAAIALVIGVQTFWIARALDSIDRRLDRLETRLVRTEGPPALRRL